MDPDCPYTQISKEESELPQRELAELVAKRLSVEVKFIEAKRKESMQATVLPGSTRDMFNATLKCCFSTKCKLPMTAQRTLSIHEIEERLGPRVGEARVRPTYPGVEKGIPYCMAHACENLDGNPRKSAGKARCAACESVVNRSIKV